MADQAENNQRIAAQVTRLMLIGSQYCELTVQAAAEFPYRAGQHTTLTWKYGATSITNYYSIASAPRADQTIEFCVQMDQNPQTIAALAQLAVGSRVELSPARGSFTWRPTTRPIIMIAGGSGIAPLRAILQQALTTPLSQTPVLVYGCRSGRAVPYAAELQGLHKSNHLQLCITVEKDLIAGQVSGRVTAHMRQYLQSDADYYLCGPRGMMQAVQDVLGENGIAAGRIFHENA